MKIRFYVTKQSIPVSCEAFIEQRCCVAATAFFNLSLRKAYFN